jgi:protein involved in polysaccharide export with SLBB domain
MKIKIILLTTLALLSSVCLKGQSIQDQLIKKKAGELGVSEEELRKKAGELGYDVTGATDPEAVERVTPVVVKQDITPPQKSVSSYKVPEFENRSGLNAYGYNIFNYSPSTFEPGLNVPVPRNYFIGPGDEIIISLWGETQLVKNFIVSKEGTIYLQEAGVITVVGLTIEEVKSKMFNILSRTYASLKSKNPNDKTYMELTTGALRTVKVFCLGEIVRPGGYSLPSLSTAFTALYYSGGPKISGSLRNIKIIRNGEVAAKLDLYQYLTSGIISNDISLQEGDVIYVERVGKRVALQGNVFKPAIYELEPNEKFMDIIKYSGGINFNTYTERVSVDRVIPFSERKFYDKNIIKIDLNFSSKEELLESEFEFDDGDVVTLFSVNTLMENSVAISGAVKKPGTYELSDGMKISDLILKADSLKEEVFVEQAVLYRTLPTLKKEMFTFNLQKAIEKDPAHNFTLENRDEIQIFNHQRFFPTRSVQIYGQVNDPGSYSRLEGMTLKDLITIAGGFTFNASLENVELSRLDTSSIEKYYNTFSLKFDEEYWTSDIGEDFLLEDFDRVSIKTDPKRKSSDVVRITGEVQFPGSYAILAEGERVADFIKRSGGFLNTAYLEGMFVKRENRFKTGAMGNQLKMIADSMSLAGGATIEVSYYDRVFLDQFSDRIPLEWEEIADDNNSIYNLMLLPGDEIVVPDDDGVVYVSGEVGVESIVPYQAGKGLDYYIEQAGGFTSNSSEGRVVVMLPNGKKWDKGGFLGSADDILSGTKIFVPTEISVSFNHWEVIRDITSIVASAALLVLTIQNIAK